MLSNNVQARQDILTEVESQISMLSHILIGEVKSDTKKKEINREALLKWTKSAKERIQETRRAGTEVLQKPFHFIEPFVRDLGNLTVADVAAGRKEKLVLLLN